MALTTIEPFGINSSNSFTFGNVTATGNVTGTYFVGNGSQLTGITAGTSYTNANVEAYLPTYTGNLVSLTGDVTTTANISANYVLGNGSALTSITGANVTGQVSNALVAGTVYTAAQPNITSVGTLTALGVTGNVTTGNILTNGYFFANGVPFTGGGSVGGTFDVFARSGAIVVSVIAGFFNVGTRNSGTLKVAVS